MYFVKSLQEVSLVPHSSHYTAPISVLEKKTILTFPCGDNKQLYFCVNTNSLLPYSLCALSIVVFYFCLSAKRTWSYCQAGSAVMISVTRSTNCSV